MSCFRPLTAYRWRRDGSVTIGEQQNGVDADRLELPCSRCIGCKLDRACSWSTRIVHESQLWDSNLFLTLTYATEKLRSHSLEYEDFSGFMKRLRRRLVGVTGLADGRRPIRFFCAGEYGGQTGRPHFHAILFNVRFPDQVKISDDWSRSELAEELWSNGMVHIGDVTARSAAYVAGYTLKKVHGQAAAEHYEDLVDTRTGEVSSRRPELAQMSRRPGIGAWWFRRFGSDVFPHDKAFREGRFYKVPRYYWHLYKASGDPGRVEEVQYGRFLRAMESREESTPERRAVREEVATRRAEMFGGRGL